MRYRIRRSGKLVLILPVAAALGWMVMVLWNAVLPSAFPGARPLDYWHAVGLLVLSRILFGGVRGRGNWRRHRNWRRFEAMTPEERERFRESFSARCGRGQEQT